MTTTNEHPLITSARREAIAAMGIWLLATIWSVGYCSAYGYRRNPASLTFVCGFPDWVFWGIVLPWGICTVVSSIFAFWFMKDEDLDESPTGTGD